jgi:ABC-type sulfate/molybdate transport systems ATPase subunit
LESQAHWAISNSSIVYERSARRCRYKRALTAAQLATDLDELPDSDLTEIGERGVTLSGGQKHRVSIARAIYADADVYILDDPLSAVDAHVGKALFDQCICGALKGKTVLLVTNALQHVHRADTVIWLVDGVIKKQGPHAVVHADPEFSELVGSHVIAEDVTEGELIGAGDKKAAKDAGVLAKMNVSGGDDRNLTGVLLWELHALQLCCGRSRCALRALCGATSLLAVCPHACNLQRLHSMLCGFGIGRMCSG